MRILLACLLFGLLGLNLQAQNKIELLGAKSLKFDEDLGVGAQRLIGNVRFRHKGAIMYCDSAYLYDADNSIDAFGNVKIVQGDTLTMHAEKLFYNGNSQLVQIRDSVRLIDQDMSLTTNSLDYDRLTTKAIYHELGTITSTQNDNKLVSKHGIYHSEIKMFYFRDSVRLENPNYLVVTDTLNYANNSEIAYFEGPTFIYSDENTIYCENGWYDTKLDLSQFNENAYLDNGKQKLGGDSLKYDRNLGIGEAFLNVQIADSIDQTLILGQYGYYNELKGTSLVTGEPEFIQYDGLDSLYLHGDTLFAINDTLNGDRISVYPEVRFYRKDMQGAADSVVYSKSDSLIHMFRNPILWADDMQITGDTINIKSFAGQIQNLFVFDHAFMVNKLDSAKFNQIKGKKLTGYFRDNELYKVLINGNGESIYYAAESPSAQDSSTAVVDSIAVAPEVKYVGVNKAICSNIGIYMKSNQIDRIVFLNKPDGAFYPVHKFPEEESIFKGFEWQAYRRPLSRADIFKSPVDSDSQIPEADQSPED